MLASLTGFRFAHGGTARFRWGEVSRGWGLAFGLCMFEEHFSLHLHLGWPNMYIRLPFLRRWHRDPREMMESWGASWVGLNAIHLNWGDRCKIIHMPWSWEWQRTSVLLADGSWCHETRQRRAEFPNYPDVQSKKIPWGSFHKIKEELAWRETYPYRYVLRSGEVQERTATVTVEEREWRWRWLQGLPFPRTINRTIDVNFNDEVGERSGSWKGGCLGCGYELRHDELPQESLRRMERKRKF